MQNRNPVNQFYSCEFNVSCMTLYNNYVIYNVIYINYVINIFENTYEIVLSIFLFLNSKYKKVNIVVN